MYSSSISITSTIYYIQIHWTSRDSLEKKVKIAFPSCTTEFHPDDVQSREKSSSNCIERVTSTYKGTCEFTEVEAQNCWALVYTRGRKFTFVYTLIKSSFFRVQLLRVRPTAIQPTPIVHSDAISCKYASCSRPYPLTRSACSSPLLRVSFQSLSIEESLWYNWSESWTQIFAWFLHLDACQWTLERYILNRLSIE